MRPPRAAHPTRAWIAAAGGRLGGIAPAGGSEHRQILLQPLRSAFGTRRARPFAGTHKDFAVRPALRAMKLINRHTDKLPPERSSGNRKISPQSDCRWERRVTLITFSIVGGRLEGNDMRISRPVYVSLLRHQPEKLVRASDDVGVRTGRAGDVGEDTLYRRRSLKAKDRCGIIPSQDYIILE